MQVILLRVGVALGLTVPEVMLLSQLRQLMPGNSSMIAAS